MNSDDEIPASPQTPNKKRRRRPIVSINSKKRIKYIEKNDVNVGNTTPVSVADDDVISCEKSQEASSTMEVESKVIEVETEAPLYVDVYSLPLEGCAGPTRMNCQNVDLFKGVKLLEMANAKPYTAKKSEAFQKLCVKKDDKLLSFSQLYKNEIDSQPSSSRNVLNRIENSRNVKHTAGRADETNKPASNCDKLRAGRMVKFDTQAFDETDSQISEACNVADAAEMQLMQPTRNAPLWRTPVRISEPESRNIVESILTDFECETTELAVQRERCQPRTYSRSTATSPSSKVTAKVGENTTAAEDYVDVDLNSSMNIIENLANLSSFFSQSTETGETVINVESSAHLLSANGTLSDNLLDMCEVMGNVNDISFGQFHNDENVSHCDDNENVSLLFEVKACDDAKHVAVKLNTEDALCEMSLLDEDEEVFQSIAMTQLQLQLPVKVEGTAIIKRTRKSPECSTRLRTAISIEHRTMVPDKGKSTVSEPIGFCTGRGSKIAVSTRAMRKTVGVFDDIDKDVVLPAETDDVDIFGVANSTNDPAGNCITPRAQLLLLNWIIN